MQLKYSVGVFALIALFATTVRAQSEKASSVAGAKKPPNVIFLMTDDQRYDNFGCYGRPEFRTRNIDRLASQGVIFDHTNYAVAICIPCRVTIMTGRYLSNHRVGFSPPYNHTLPQASFRDSYPVQLKQAGYRTDFIGKFGFSVTETEKRFNGAKDYDYETHLKQYFDFFAADGSHGGRTSQFFPHDDEGLRAIYEDKWTKPGRTLRNGQAMLRFLDTQSKDKPFCLSVSFLAVKHDRNSDLHQPHFALFKDQKYSVPEIWVEGSNGKLPSVVREHWRGSRLHVQRSSTPAMYQRLVRRFAAQGFSVDQQVGLMMDKLKETGLLNYTIVIYTSDNGRFQGSQGLFDKGLLYDESMKQPLIVSMVEHHDPNEAVGRMRWFLRLMSPPPFSRWRDCNRPVPCRAATSASY